jgi:hypothetical protein
MGLTGAVVDAMVTKNLIRLCRFRLYLEDGTAATFSGVSRLRCEITQKWLVSQQLQILLLRTQQQPAQARPH